MPLTRWRTLRSGAAPERLPVDPDLASPRGSRQPLPFGALSLLLVGIGGALGTLGRYELGLAMASGAGSFPTATFIVNVSGAFAIGFTLSVLAAKHQMGSWRLFSCVGVLGGWTTMSTLAVGADELVARGNVLVGFAYVLASLVAGTLATALGIGIATRTVASEEP